MSSPDAESDSSTNSSRHSFYNLCATTIAAETTDPYTMGATHQASATTVFPRSPSSSTDGSELCHVFSNTTSICPHKFLPREPPPLPSVAVAATTRGGAGPLLSLKQQHQHRSSRFSARRRSSVPPPNADSSYLLTLSHGGCTNAMVAGGGGSEHPRVDGAKSSSAAESGRRHFATADNDPRTDTIHLYNQGASAFYRHTDYVGGSGGSGSRNVTAARNSRPMSFDQRPPEFLRSLPIIACHGTSPDSTRQATTSEPENVDSPYVRDAERSVSRRTSLGMPSDWDSESKRVSVSSILLACSMSSSAPEYAHGHGKGGRQESEEEDGDALPFTFTGDSVACSKPPRSKGRRSLPKQHSADSNEQLSPAQSHHQNERENNRSGVHNEPNELPPVRRIRHRGRRYKVANKTSVEGIGATYCHAQELAAPSRIQQATVDCSSHTVHDGGQVPQHLPSAPVSTALQPSAASNSSSGDLSPMGTSGGRVGKPTPYRGVVREPMPPMIDIISPSPTLSNHTMKTSQSIGRMLSHAQGLSHMCGSGGVGGVSPDLLGCGGYHGTGRSSGTSSSGSLSPASSNRCLSSHSNSSVDSSGRSSTNSPSSYLANRIPGKLRRHNLLPPLNISGGGSRAPSTASSSRTSSPFDVNLSPLGTGSPVRYNVSQQSYLDYSDIDCGEESDPGGGGGKKNTSPLSPPSPVWYPQSHERPSPLSASHSTGIARPASRSVVSPAPCSSSTTTDPMRGVCFSPTLSPPRSDLVPFAVAGRMWSSTSGDGRIGSGGGNECGNGSGSGRGSGSEHPKQQQQQQQQVFGAGHTTTRGHHHPQLMTSTQPTSDNASPHHEGGSRLPVRKLSSPTPRPPPSGDIGYSHPLPVHVDHAITVRELQGVTAGSYGTPYSPSESRNSSLDVAPPEKGDYYIPTISAAHTSSPSSSIHNQFHLPDITDTNKHKATPNSIPGGGGVRSSGGIYNKKSSQGRLTLKLNAADRDSRVSGEMPGTANSGSIKSKHKRKSTGQSQVFHQDISLQGNSMKIVESVAKATGSD